MRVLGIDPGKKRVGLAIGSTELKIATGYKLLKCKSDEQLLTELKPIIDEEEIKLIVLGLPKNMDGTEGKSAIKSKILADFISKKLDIDVKLIDERLSTVEATRQIHSADKKIGNSKEIIDILAATVILQSYFDGLN